MAGVGVNLHPGASGTTVLRKTMAGAGWTIGWRFANRIIGFGSTLILVRLLVPADFGLVSLAIGFFQSLDQFIGFGVEGALIRADRADRTIYDAGFTINVLRGAFTGAMLAACAPWIAGFFASPQLAGMIYVLSLAWVAAAFQNIGLVEFRRNMAFDMEFKVQIVPRVLALGVTMPIAFIWHTYWALIGGLVATRLITVAMSYIVHPYRPRLGIAGMRYIFGFSFWEWMIGMLNMASYRSDGIMIGRVLGPGAIGIYGVGAEIASLPSSEIVAPLCRALFSGFVVERREGGDGTATLFRVYSVLALLTFPLCVGLSLVAYPVVKLGFGEAWLGAVPLVQISGVGALLTLFGPVLEALFSAHAWLRSLLWVSAAAALARVILLLVLVPSHGLIGAVAVAVVMGVLMEAAYIALAVRRIGLRVLPLLLTVARPAVSSLVMAAALNAVGLGWWGWGQPGGLLWLNLGLAVAIGAATYAATLVGLWMLAGRPAGAEADALALCRRTLPARGR